LGADLRLRVAVDAGTLVGALEAQISAQEIFVNNVAVSPARRREGIGNRLLADSLQGDSSGRTLKLHVLESNVAALEWYTRLGMQRISSVGWYCGELPESPGASAILSGYPQMMLVWQRFGFANLALKGAERSATVGILGDDWLRFA